ncbi:hypothetical protein ACFOWE_02845 [Planomonospora corallina]|uniref:Uncharacterized protein n=1 Tax=Planomonospora corallina TaxID=1806052 RepID=A0ABV8HZG8_9ACTN
MIWRTVISLIGVLLLWISVPNIGPAVRAARADGVPGVFTARTLQCVQHPGHESCTWIGDFRSAAGQEVRSSVALHGSGRDSLTAGATTPAVDVGRPYRVYGPDGSAEWIFTSLLACAGLGILLFQLRALRTRRRPGRSPEPEPEPDRESGSSPSREPDAASLNGPS